MTPFGNFRDQEHTRAQGRAAEDDGVAWLSGQGFRIVGRNVQYRAGEIDVIALEDETLCFIEIKARSSDRFGTALWAVGKRKQRQIVAAASLFLATDGHTGPCRFDVLAMDGNKDDWHYTLVRNAFELD